jgi:hypothetical protein
MNYDTWLLECHIKSSIVRVNLIDIITLRNIFFTCHYNELAKALCHFKWLDILIRFICFKFLCLAFECTICSFEFCRFSLNQMNLS